jgi:hypothetical protein
MADTKISALTELAATPATTDELAINDGGVSKRITIANLMNFTADDVITFTNKTFDANGTGNSITNIENADIAAGAAIAYSKLNLTGTIVDADIADAADVKQGTITFVIDGGGSAISTGVKGYLEIPFACTIDRQTMLLDQSSTTTLDIWKDTYANYPPVDADSITASAQPSTSATNKDQDATLTGWTTTITAGDILGFNVDANDNATTITIWLFQL